MVDNRNGNNMYLFLFKENLEILVVMIHISNDKYLFVTTPGRYKGQNTYHPKVINCFNDLPCTVPRYTCQENSFHSLCRRQRFQRQNLIQFP